MTKNRLFKLFVMAIFLAYLFLICGVSQAFDTSLLIAPKEVVRAAHDGLHYYIDQLPDWELSHFNFGSRDEFKDAKVGTPFRVFVTHPNEILKSDPQKKLLDLVHPLPMWFFPVSASDKFRTVLTVDFVNKKWKAIGIGNSDLAKSFAHVLAAWPPTRGYKDVFVRDYRTYSEFVILIHDQETSVIPLPNAIKVWGLREEKILSQSEGLLLLKKRLDEVNRRNKNKLFNW